MIRRAKKRQISCVPENQRKRQSVNHSVEENVLSKESLRQLEQTVFGGILSTPTEEIKPVLKDNDDTAVCASTSAWFDEDEVDSVIEGNAPKLDQWNNGNTVRKNQFEKALGPTPQWALLNSTSIENEINDDDELPSKYLADTTAALPKDSLDITRCIDVNKQRSSQRKLEACEFHQSSQIAMTASQDCSLNLFQIDGKTNSLIHSLFTEKFRIRCAHFLSDGTQIAISSSMRWLYNYDLISGKVLKVQLGSGIRDSKMKSFKVSPDGKHLIFLSSFGKMHILDSVTKELVSTLKMNGSVEDIAFLNSGQQMLSFGDEGVVYVWDMNSRLCVNTFVDDGCVNGTSLATSPNNNLIACGSYSGVVNLYNGSCINESEPKVVKAFMNLHTPVTSLTFNSTSEILALGSDSTPSGVKLAHMASMQVFPNFPGFTNQNLQLPQQLGFSPNSGYFLIGNSKGCAPLFRLNHYQNY